MAVSWGAVNRPKAGQTTSGDAYVVEAFNPNGLQVALIDGLGGGAEAAEAATTAARVVQASPAQDSSEILRRSHVALRGTRGAVMALLTFDFAQCSVSYVGVGNIGLYVWSSMPIRPISRNGIVGYRMPALFKQAYTYHLGDTFVLYSDGVSGRFAFDPGLDFTGEPQELAERIVCHHGQSVDDASVLIVRPTA